VSESAAVVVLAAAVVVLLDGRSVAGTEVDVAGVVTEGSSESPAGESLSALEHAASNRTDRTIEAAPMRIPSF
jgi:hypothetical protein